MNLTGLIGKKIDQTQGFLEDGTRVPISIVSVAGNRVAHIKTQEKEGYAAVQLGFGQSKKPTKAIAGHSKKAGMDNTPRIFREIRVDEPIDVEASAEIVVTEIFKPGDILDVSGVSKGKGYAGVVKRHHFRGGPRTHGQSDRERAPGSIGQSTTPGRVYKGKKMSGRMGSENVTVKNLQILDVTDEQILIKGLIPGPRGSIVVLTKKGENKNPSRLWRSEPSLPTEGKKFDEDQVEEVTTAEEEIKTAEESVETSEETVETSEEVTDVSETVETPTEEVSEEKKEENGTGQG